MLRLSFLGGSTAEATASRLRQALPGTVLSRSHLLTDETLRKKRSGLDRLGRVAPATWARAKPPQGA